MAEIDDCHHLQHIRPPNQEAARQVGEHSRRIEDHLIDQASTVDKVKPHILHVCGSHVATEPSAIGGQLHGLGGHADSQGRVAQHGDVGGGCGSRIGKRHYNLLTLYAEDEHLFGLMQPTRSVE